MKSVLPITVARTSAADRPVYELRGPAGDVLHATRSQTQLRDLLLGLEHQCAPGEQLAITWLGVPGAEALWAAWRKPMSPRAARGAQA